ncbi:uncharacterized protein AAG666_023274 [Megaptera novaeangliae]
MLEPLQGAAGLRSSGNRQGGDARVCPAEAATRARLLGLGRVLPALIRGAGPPGPRQAACWISELYSPAVLCQSALRQSTKEGNPRRMEMTARPWHPEAEVVRNRGLPATK